MPKIFIAKQSVNDFVYSSKLESIPRPDTRTSLLYNEYFNYCLDNQLEPATIGVLTRDLKLYGYYRMSARINNRVEKVYRYTGKKQQVCPECQGTGLLTLQNS